MNCHFRIRNGLLSALFLLISVIAEANGCFSEEFTLVCRSPEVYVCDNFLSDEECDHLIKLARPELERSTVVDPNSSNRLIDSARTSQGMFLSSECTDETVLRIHDRIAKITGFPEENGENMQILFYAEGGQYLPHYDSFDPKTPGGKIHFNRGGQRAATFMIYLNTPDKGGETIFPRAGLKISPTKGKAVFFYNIDDTGQVDVMSLHGGAPVIKGEKWIITRWLREHEFY